MVVNKRIGKLSLWTPGITNTPYCLSFAMSGVTQEVCYEPFIGYSGAPPDADLADGGNRILQCYNGVDIGDVLPKCWR